MSGGGAVLQAAQARFKPRAAAVFGAGYTFTSFDAYASSTVTIDISTVLHIFKNAALSKRSDAT